MNKLVLWPVSGCLALASSLGCARVDPKEQSTEDAGMGAPGPTGAATGGSAGPGSGGTGGSPWPGSGGADGGRPLFEADSGTGDGSVCGLVHSTLERQPPDVLILLDRSASMRDQVIPPGYDVGMFILCLLLKNCPPTMSKWDAMTSALETSVTAGSAAVNYGLKLFPEDENCGVADGAAVPIAADNARAINDKLAGTMPGGATPTTTALASAGRYLSNLGRPNPRFVLLATDGEPTCGGNAAAATTAVSNLAAAGIPVYVIGIATEGMADAALSSMAMAGGRPRSASPPYYPVQTAADLSATLSAIGGQIASCSFSVRPPDPPADPNNVAVKANGSRVPKSDTDGWRYGPDMTSIELTGTWCDQIQSGAISDLEASFACAEAVIP